jgi:hypothetical protein
MVRALAAELRPLRQLHSLSQVVLRLPPMPAEDARVQSIEPAELCARLSRVIERALEVNTRAFEESDDDVTRRDLVDPLATLATEARAVLFSVLERYDGDGGQSDESPDSRVPAPENTGDFDRLVDQVMRRPDGAQQICDLCVMARLELGAKTTSLLSLPAGRNRWSIVAASASIRRKLVKSAAAVETCIAAHEGLASLTRGAFATELQRSLEVRLAYARVRRHARTAPVADSASVRSAVRLAGVSIAQLIGLDVYEYMRVEDRILVRSIQNRLTAWLCDQSPAPLAGQRLLQEFAAFAGLLQQVNNRAELRAHDLELASSMMDTLANNPDEPLDRAILVRLKLLTGRDDDLDALLTAANVPTRRECSALLDRLRKDLGGAVGSVPPASPL